MRVSLRREIDEDQDSFEFAMNFLYKNFSEESNKTRYPEVLAVPDQIKPQTVLKPSLELYEPPSKIMHFKAGNFSQRLIFYTNINNPKWDDTEAVHVL